MRLNSASRLIFGLLLLGSTFSANANLITNGTFDTDLSGWLTSPTGTGVPTTWIDGTAHLGRPGQEGISNLAQIVDIVPGTQVLEFVFDYEWQVNPPSTPDSFLAGLLLLDGFGAYNTVWFEFEQSSSDAAFGTTVQFSSQISLAGAPLLGAIENAAVLFRLTETVNDPASAGTRIQIDNVSLTATSVPAPATLTILGLGLAGLGYSRRSKG